MTSIVLSGGHLGGEVVELATPKTGDQIKLDDPTRPGRRRLVYEVREHQDEDGSAIGGSYFAVFTGTEQ